MKPFYRAVGRKWYEENPNINLNWAEVNNWAETHADIEKNAKAVMVINKGENYHEPRYENKIATLLGINTDELGKAEGIIDSVAKPKMVFDTVEKTIIIQHPPCIFADEDIIIFKSLIIHELQHAFDWLNPDYRAIPIDDINTDWKLYVQYLLEVRAYSAQLRLLLRELGNVKLVRNALNREPEFKPIKPGSDITGPRANFGKMHEGVKRCAMAFLDLHEKELGKSIMGELFIPGQLELAEHCATLVTMIMNKLLFRNFVHVSI